MTPAGPGADDPRAVALAVARAGLEACDPAAAVRRAVAPDAAGIRIAGVHHPLAPGAGVVVLGAGKASLPIVVALEAVLRERVRGGAVVVRDGESADLGRVEMLVADHPLPSERSHAAARRLLELAAATTPQDLVIACFTGGSSALVSLPPAGVSLEEKRELHRLLLSAGLPVTDVNTVRKHVSLIKGGRLAQALAGRRVVNLTVSDVAGDHLDEITDPTGADTTTAADAVAVLHAAELWNRVAPSIRAHLSAGRAESPALVDGGPATVLLATGATACAAMADAATRHGHDPVVVSTALEGEAREVGRLLATLARESAVRGGPFAPPCVLVGCGGETTVTLRDGLEQGAFGDGGPNQEVALGFALGVAGLADVAAVFVDTDGSDGGTDVAGAIVDGATAGRAATQGLDVAGALRAHRTRAVVAALGDAVRTGPTGTNVNDLFAIAIGPAAGEAPR
jgi:glycerate 2-kinase